MLLTKISRFVKVAVLSLSLGLSSIVLSGCGGGGGGASVPTSPPTPDKDALRIACVGDSITQGTELRNPSISSYPAVLARLLGRRYNVGNFGRGGSTLLSGTSRSYNITPAYSQALAFKPEIVVIMLGTNDSILKTFDPNLKLVFIRDYKSLIADFKTASPGAQFFLCLPPPNFVERENRKGNLQDNVLPLIAQVAADEGAKLIDLNTPLLDEPELFNSGLHPDEEGAEIMANEVRRTIMRVLNPAGVG